MPLWCVALHVGVGGFPSDRVRWGLEDAVRRACAAAHGALQRTLSAAAVCEAAGLVHLLMMKKILHRERVFVPTEIFQL
ncbi:hypothetical protein DIPPA_10816 [Diplonema papillatum]|nr:hypothetical protein DIPPA_10816 [Diplonema papillatum]